MKLAILAAVVAAATTIPTVTAVTPDNPFNGGGAWGRHPFEVECGDILGILDDTGGSTATCTYEITTPFSVESQIGHAGPVWTVSGTTTDTFVATWEAGTVTILQTEEGDPIVTSCINHNGQPVDLHNPNCQVPEP